MGILLQKLIPNIPPPFWAIQIQSENSFPLTHTFHWAENLNGTILSLQNNCKSSRPSLLSSISYKNA
jgi:hypothetical protein